MLADSDDHCQFEGIVIGVGVNINNRRLGELKLVKQHIAAFKIPSAIEFRSEQLPRGATGKILKRQIRDEVAAQREG